MSGRPIRSAAHFFVSLECEKTIPSDTETGFGMHRSEYPVGICLQVHSGAPDSTDDKEGIRI